MNFFLKNPSTQTIEGPFTIDAIKAKLEEGVLNCKWLATSDLGETLSELKRLPGCDWTMLGELPEFAPEIQEPITPVKKPTSPLEWGSVLASAILGIALGYKTGRLSSGVMEAGIFFMVVGAVINPILVCFVARRLWFLVSVVPVLTSIITLTWLNYQQKSKYEEVTFAAFYQPMALISVLVFLLPALLTAGIFHALKK